ncbi:MAG: M20 family metallopeptidase [Deferrisomatales bacterium]
METTEYVARFLAERDIAFERAPSGTGGVARVGAGEPVVLLRADLDALPVEERTGAACRSRHPGRMHACGHDAHAAMLLAAADALQGGDAPCRGTVVCLFQPAEEGSGGCRRLLRDGLLHRHPVRAAAALHVWPGLPTGSVGLTPGPVMAGMDNLRLTVRGRGGHGAHPHHCADPVVMAAQGVLAFQTLVSRSTNPLDPAVLTVGSIRGGSAPNVIPDEVVLDGTIRAYDAAVRQGLLEGIERVGRGIAAAHGGTFELAVREGYPATVNDPAATEALSRAFQEVLPPGALRPAERTMGSEDMGFLLGQVPGGYLQLGCAADPRRAEPLHSPRFDIDESCLEVGVAVLLTAAWALGRWVETASAGPERG